MRSTKLSVTNFIYCKDEFLFLKRNLSKKIDPGKLNGVGGKVDPGEDYLSAVIRETREETGLHIVPSQIRLRGVIRLEGGYKEDWVMCFFTTRVRTKKTPLGPITSDGELLWIHKAEVLSGAYDVVDDIHYCFSSISHKKEVLFMSALVGRNHIITHTSIQALSQ